METGKLKCCGEEDQELGLCLSELVGERFLCVWVLRYNPCSLILFDRRRAEVIFSRQLLNLEKTRSLGTCSSRYALAGWTVLLLCL